MQVNIDDDQVKNGDQTEIHDSPNDDKDEAKQELKHEEDKDKDLPKAWSYANAHPKELIIGEENQGVKTRSSFNLCNNLAFLSQFEPKTFHDALNDEFWILAM